MPHGVPRGISASFLVEHVMRHPLYDPANTTTYALQKSVVLPATAEGKCLYVDLFDGATDSSGRPSIGPANVFVSHAWAYIVHTTSFEVMLRYAATHPDTYFYFDVFTNNQHIPVTQVPVRAPHRRGQRLTRRAGRPT